MAAELKIGPAGSSVNSNLCGIVPFWRKHICSGLMRWALLSESLLALALLCQHPEPAIAWAPASQLPASFPSACWQAAAWRELLYVLGPVARLTAQLVHMTYCGPV